MLKAIGYDSYIERFKLFNTATKRTEHLTVQEVKDYLRTGKRIRGIVLNEETNPMFTFDGMEVNFEYPVRLKVGKWNVAILYGGDVYGRSMSSTVNDITVFFYDSSVKWPRGQYPLGQFVASYYAKTIVSHEGPLCLNREVEAWTVTGEEMKKITSWLKKDIL